MILCILLSSKRLLQEEIEAIILEDSSDNGSYQEQSFPRPISFGVGGYKRFGF